MVSPLSSESSNPSSTATRLPAAAFQLGPWTVRPRPLELEGRDGAHRRVGPKVMAVLVALVERPGEVVTKDELMARCWEGSFTSDEALTAVLYELRKALDDDARKPRFIETIRGVGYRLKGVPEPVPGADRATPEIAGDVPADRLAEGRGTGEHRGRRTESRPRRLFPRALILLVLLTLAGWLGLGLLDPPDPESMVGEATRGAMPGVASDALPPGAIRSLAVLPLTGFSAQSSSQPRDSLALALTDMLTADLAQLCPQEVTPGIAVRGGVEPPERWRLDQVSEVLGVDAVVEGSVLRSDEQLWISMQLVETATGRLLWSDSWQRTLGDEVLILREVALDAAQQVQERLALEAPPYGPRSEP